MAADKERILARWSRRKREAAQEATRSPPPAPKAEDSAPVLPPIDALGPDSDFSAFMHPKVGEDLRRAALKKLFRDPHFNICDGLDDYAEDYTVFESLTPEMVDELQHARSTLRRPAPEPEKESAQPEQDVAQDATQAAEAQREDDHGEDPTDVARRQDA